MVKGDNEPENLKLRFLVEGTEIDVPEHFHLFSVVVENYIKTYLVDDNGTPKFVLFSIHFLYLLF